jgi:hypothetical protein
MKRFMFSLALAGAFTAAAQAAPPARPRMPAAPAARPAVNLSRTAPSPARGVSVLSNTAVAPSNSALENIYDPFCQTRRAAYQIRTIGRALQEVPPEAFPFLLNPNPVPVPVPVPIPDNGVPWARGVARGPVTPFRR